MTTVLETDEFCLGCGYNLRGLSGDPIRCPECGLHNSRYALSIRPVEVAGHVKYMTSVLDQSASGAGTALAIAAFVAFARGPAGLLLFLVTVGALTIAINFVRFRGLCHGRDGWVRGFFDLHALNFVAAIVSIIAAVGFIFGIRWALGSLHFRINGSDYFGAVILFAVLAFVIVVLSVRKHLYRPLHGRILGTIKPLSTAVARELVRLEQRAARRRD